ncbi:MAG: endopeptidase La [Verrucomicrobiae bacterium]|nr:endopeptidase La [Verrucomicrobiae bacterium]
MSAPQEPVSPPESADEGKVPSDRRPPASPLKEKETPPSLLPVMPLSDVVVFPFMVAPLLVNTKSSVRLVDEVVAGNRLLLLVLQKKPDQEDPGPQDLYGSGCIARVLKMLKFPDDTTRVLAQGIQRARVLSCEKGPSFLQAAIQPVEDVITADLEMEALTRNATKVFSEVITLSPHLPDEMKVAALNMEDAGKLADLIAANLNLQPPEKQKFLENADVKARLKSLVVLLKKELDVLQLGSEIQTKVSDAVGKHQREYILREQIRQIHKELGEAESGNGEIRELKEKIEKAGIPAEVRKVADKELGRLAIIPTASAEYTVARTYLDWLIAMPWTKHTADHLDVARARRILDADHYGLKKVKERILEHLAILKLKTDKKGPILCFAGPPGVGKTSLGMSIARALGRKFVRFSLGGIRDEAEIRGHRRTYVGALPGRVIQGLRKAESSNPVFMLDEIDKVGADFRGDPSSALLEVLDPTQNFTFSDHYLEVPFDLSRVLFITTANWLEPVPPALRDRMEVIEIPGYTDEEKLHIAADHLIPRQRDEHGLKDSQVRIPAATVRALLAGYTREAGVRNLDREIASLCRKAGRLIVERKRRRMTLHPSDLHGFLGLVRFFNESAERTSEAGVATGLAWTPAGGEVLFVEAIRVPGKGNLILTGSLGDVMRESAQAALSYVKAHATRLKIASEIFEKSDLHIHIPSGATPKDGPSAGVALAVALASLLTGRKTFPHVAMTGEISLLGRVLPVGGVKEKALAAARSGIRKILLPRKNLRDLEEIPKDVRRRLKFVAIRDVGQALREALE